MAAVTTFLGLLTTVAISVSVLQAFQYDENISEVSDKRLRDMERKFKDLLAKTKTEMDDKYTSLLNDHVALTNRFEKVENDNMELKDSVSSLKLKNLELENRFLKLQNDTIRKDKINKWSKPSQSQYREEIKRSFADGTNTEDSSGKRGSDPNTQRQDVSISNERRLDSLEKRLLLPFTSTPSPVPVPTQARVAFHVRLSQHLTNAGDSQHLEFNNVITNVGNAYLGATSTFACPVTGTYVFTWTILSFPDKHIQTEIVLNGNPKGYTYSYNDVHFNSGSNAVVLDLQEHDTVWVRVNNANHDNGTVANSYYSTFSGFILWSNPLN